MCFKVFELRLKLLLFEDNARRVIGGQGISGGLSFVKNRKY